MLYNILKPLHVTIDGEHHDTLRQDYPGCFSYFANIYGTVRWRDTTTPRTDAPVRFIPRTRNPALLAREGFNPGSFTIRWA